MNKIVTELNSMSRRSNHQQHFAYFFCGCFDQQFLFFFFLFSFLFGLCRLLLLHGLELSVLPAAARWVDRLVDPLVDLSMDRSMDCLVDCSGPGAVLSAAGGSLRSMAPKSLSQRENPPQAAGLVCLCQGRARPGSPPGWE